MIKNKLFIVNSPLSEPELFDRQRTGEHTYIFKYDEVKIVLTIYYPATGEFLGLEETKRFIDIRGDSREMTFNYDF